MGTHGTSAHTSFGMIGIELPPGMVPSRLSHPPRTLPQYFSMKSFSGLLSSSSTTQGFLKCPECSRTSRCARPNYVNCAPPRQQIVRATATATDAGQPNRPTSAGNGGLLCASSRLSIGAISSPHMHAPAPRCRYASNW